MSTSSPKKPSLVSLIACFACVGALAYAGTRWQLSRGHPARAELVLEESTRPVTALREVTPRSVPMGASDPIPILTKEAGVGVEIPARKLHPRHAREWQGMRADETEPMDCEASVRCGLAEPRPATTEEVVDPRAPVELGAPHVLERNVREHAIAFEHAEQGQH